MSEEKNEIERCKYCKTNLSCADHVTCEILAKLEENKALDIIKMIREWGLELEEKIEAYPRKISLKKYVEDIIRLGKIEELIYYLIDTKSKLNSEKENE